MNNSASMAIRMTLHSKFGSQRGATLVVAILLLLILSLSTLFAARVGIFEQRTSASDMRARIAQQTAATALHHGVSTMRVNTWATVDAGSVPDPDLWELCGAADTSFPCGAVPATATVNGAAVLRSSYYRYVGNVDGEDYNGDGTVDSLEDYMIPLAPLTTAGAPDRQTVDQVGNFPVEYGVGALLCTVDEDSRCTTVANDRTGLSVTVLVARASVGGEAAIATQTAAFGSYKIFDVPPDTPPLVAGGILEGLGSSTIVANANSGGAYGNSGVNVTVWSRFGMDGRNGSWQTCQAEEYFRDGSAITEGDSKIVTCDNCNCPADKQDSNGKDGYGPDILDPRADADLDQARRSDVFSNAFSAAASKTFPCDVFQFVFGVQARTDASSAGEEFYPVCEGDAAVDDKDGDNRSDAADDFLKDNFTELASCAALTAAATAEGGSFWVPETGSQCQLSGNIGTADHPVIIVVEDEVKPNTSLKMFGLLFIRNPVPEIPQTRAEMEDFEGPGWGSGGGNATVYGAVVIDGGGKVNGTVNIIGNNQLLESLGNDPKNRRWGSVAGSWTDQVGY